MTNGYSFERLRARILPLSRATEWEVACKEWNLVDVWEADDPETCLCGHFPIIEICRIHNPATNKSAEVGNVCVRRFLGLRSDLIFQAIKRVRTDRTKSLNADSITFFNERGLFTEWEYRFLQDTMRKRNLSTKQAAARERINNKVLSAIRRRGLRGLD